MKTKPEHFSVIYEGFETNSALRLFLIALFVFALIESASVAQDNELATHLARLDTAVIAPSEREAAARMTERDVEKRLRQANNRSSAEWESLRTRAEWEQFRVTKLSALRTSLGQSNTPPARLRSMVTGTLIGDGYRIENVLLESRPGLWVTANLYRPETDRVSMAGILICHAHHTPKEQGELQDMGVIWARAGCLVLVMDQLGHGERRQHPFRSAADYPRSFQTSRQDYYFRYDIAIQLHLAGESLMGWMAWDLMRGVDLLLAQQNIDSKRIILLGSVAGGGDPAAVTAALDERITAAAPFNFGGPQPETRYPLPEEAETWFHYAGGGSWESTRNLRRSAADGFLPWAIVGGIAPRKLIYGHEFSWDRERDPVWKRLQTIYGFYQAAENLAFTQGRGELRGQPPEASHCTHIGPIQRRLIHAAFKQWFGIDVASESSDRHPADTLHAMTGQAERELQPKKLIEILSEHSSNQIHRARLRLNELSLDDRRQWLRTTWARLLGNIEPSRNITTREPNAPVRVDIPGAATAGALRKVERILLNVEPEIVVPVVLLLPNASKAENAGKPPVVIAVAQAGKQRFLRERAADVAALLESGRAVCLPDVRGTGETSPGSSRGRRSAATSISSGELMLGGALLGAQLRDLRSVLVWLRTRGDVNAKQLSLWGDSIVRPNAPETNLQIPRDDDQALPASPEPLGGLLAVFAALYEEDVRTVYVQGGLASFQSVLNQHLALIPHDAVVPGALATGDVAAVVAALAPRPVRLEGLVEGCNRLVPAAEALSLYETAFSTFNTNQGAQRFSLDTRRTGPSQWIGSPAANVRQSD